jgi:hypothetical protein
MPCASQDALRGFGAERSYAVAAAQSSQFLAERIIVWNVTGISASTPKGTVFHGISPPSKIAERI